MRYGYVRVSTEEKNLARFIHWAEAGSVASVA